MKSDSWDENNSHAGDDDPHGAAHDVLPCNVVDEHDDNDEVSHALNSTTLSLEIHDFLLDDGVSYAVNFANSEEVVGHQREQRRHFWVFWAAPKCSEVVGDQLSVDVDFP